MARTVQQLYNRAREILQDDAGTRYTDAQLQMHLLDALLAVRSTRPDLFINGYETPLPDSLATTDTLPVPDNLFAAIGNYVAGAAELRDDEFAVDGRAMTLASMLSKKLISGIAP